MAVARSLRNTSKQAVKLREAAFAWAEHDPYAGDSADTKGQRLNVALLKAAIAYAGSLGEGTTLVRKPKTPRGPSVGEDCRSCGLSLPCPC